MTALSSFPSPLFFNDFLDSPDGSIHDTGVGLALYLKSGSVPELFCSTDFHAVVRGEAILVGIGSEPIIELHQGIDTVCL